MTTMVYHDGDLIADTRVSHARSLEIADDNAQKVFDISEHGFTFRGEPVLKIGYAGSLEFSIYIAKWSRYSIKAMDRCLDTLLSIGWLTEWTCMVVTARGCYVISTGSFGPEKKNTVTFIPRHRKVAMVIGSGSQAPLCDLGYLNKVAPKSHFGTRWALMCAILRLLRDDKKGKTNTMAAIGFKLVSITGWGYQSAEQVIRHAAQHDRFTNDKPIRV